MASVKRNEQTGNFEVFNNGQRVSTAGTQQDADRIAASFGTGPKPVTQEEPKKTISNGFGTGIDVATLQTQQFEESQNQKTPEQIRREAAERFQGEIDTVDDLFSGLILDARTAGAARLKESQGQTRSVNAQSGILGSLRGFANTNKVTEFENQKTEAEVQALQAEKARQKSIILGKINDRADDLETAAAEAKAEGQESFRKFLEEKEANAFDDANAVLASLISEGLTFDDFSDDEAQQVADSLGISTVQLQAVYRGKLAEAAAAEAAEVNDILKEAIKAGADPETQRAIVSAESVRDALLASGSFVSEEVKQDILAQKALTTQRLASAAASQASARRSDAAAELDRDELKSKTEAPEPTAFTSNKGNEVEDQTSKEITTTLSKVAGQKVSFLIDSELNNEEKRLFLLDYRDTQESVGQTIDPEVFYKEWKGTVNFEDIRSEEEGDAAAKLQRIIEALPG